MSSKSLYPCAIIFSKGNELEICPVIIKAVDRDEAKDIAQEIGLSVKRNPTAPDHMKNGNLHVRVGTNTICTPEGVTFVREE